MSLDREATPPRGRLSIADRGPGYSHRPDDSPASIYAKHQPGVASPQLDHLVFAAFDVAAGDSSALGALLARWSAEVEGLMAAHRAPSGRRDRGSESTAGRLTLTLGLGSTVFETDGTDNLRPGRDLDRHVWVDRGERSWMGGGTFLVVRRIAAQLETWNRLPVAAQERVIGRRKGSGAPLGRRREFDAPPLEEAGEEGPVIPADAHVREAAPKTNDGAAMLRRSYSYDNGVDPSTGQRDAGLLFLAYQRDPRRQYVPVQRRLAERDALSRFTRHVGSAVFAIPPGARPKGFVAEQLLDCVRRRPPSGSGS